MVSDDTGVCRVIWFHGGYLRSQIQLGQVLMASGKPAIYKHQIQMTNPKFMVLDEKHAESDKYFSGGVYAATARLSSRQIKGIIVPVLDHVNELIGEFYDASFLKDNLIVSRKEAFAWIHMPPDEEKLAAATRRLKYDELFLMQLGLALRRYRTQHYCMCHGVHPHRRDRQPDSQAFPLPAHGRPERLHRRDRRGHEPHDADESPAARRRRLRQDRAWRSTRRCWPSPTRPRPPSWPLRKSSPRSTF